MPDLDCVATFFPVLSVFAASLDARGFRVKQDLGRRGQAFWSIFGSISHLETSIQTPVLRHGRGGSLVEGESRKSYEGQLKSYI